MNESVDLAKFFSSTKAGRFVNGVLDRFAKSARESASQEAKEESFVP